MIGTILMLSMGLAKPPEESRHAPPLIQKMTASTTSTQPMERLADLLRQDSLQIYSYSNKTSVASVSVFQSDDLTLVNEYRQWSENYYRALLPENVSQYFGPPIIYLRHDGIFALQQHDGKPELIEVISMTDGLISEERKNGLQVSTLYQ